MSSVLAAPIRDDELRFTYRERGPRLAAVRLAHQLPGAAATSSSRRGRTWELAGPSRTSGGSSTSSSWSTETAARSGSSTPRIRCARRARGATSRCSSCPATGRRSGSTRSPLGSSGRSRSKAASSRRTLPALLWAHPDAHERSPLLSPTTGRSTPSTRRSLTLLGRLPPLRAALLGPVDRNEIYSASAPYARALAEEILPAFG